MTIVNNLSELKTGIENGERNFKAGNKRTEIAMNAISHIPIIKLPKERLTSAGICAVCPPVAPIILAGGLVLVSVIIALKAKNVRLRLKTRDGEYILESY